ncbi:MAG: type II toxin-antitoxin system RelE/ParE family toxin [Polaribacter sp.]
MGYKLDIWNDAKIEIFKGYTWYEDKRVELGEEFINEVEEALEYIEKYPEHYQIKYRNKYREAVLKRFPYLIIYEIIENSVVVYSVFPSKDNPIKKPKK